MLPISRFLNIDINIWFFHLFFWTSRSVPNVHKQECPKCPKIWTKWSVPFVQVTFFLILPLFLSLYNSFVSLKLLCLLVFLYIYSILIRTFFLIFSLSSKYSHRCSSEKPSNIQLKYSERASSISWVRLSAAGSKNRFVHLLSEVSSSLRRYPLHGCWRKSRGSYRSRAQGSMGAWSRTRRLQMWSWQNRR